MTAIDIDADDSVDTPEQLRAKLKVARTLLRESTNQVNNLRALAGADERDWQPQCGVCDDGQCLVCVHEKALVRTMRLQRELDALKAKRAAPVVWAVDGMRRLHAASGTIWDPWATMDGLFYRLRGAKAGQWVGYTRKSGSLVWSWHVGDTYGAAGTEHEAIEAALKAMGGG